MSLRTGRETSGIEGTGDSVDWGTVKLRVNLQPDAQHGVCATGPDYGILEVGRPKPRQVASGEPRRTLSGRQSRIMSQLQGRAKSMLI